MASNILSRILPPVFGTPSVYETLRQHDESFEQYDTEERAGMALDEENLGVAFQDYEVDEALADAAVSRIHTSNVTKPKRKTRSSSRRVLPNQRRPQLSPKMAETDDLDDDVPLSLLIEGNEDLDPSAERRHSRETPLPARGPPTRNTRAKWEATQERQRLHQDPNPRVATHKGPIRTGLPFRIIDPKEKAMWRWANVENLDNFLKDVYDYFLGNGIWCILLCRLLNLL